MVLDPTRFSLAFVPATTADLTFLEVLVVYKKHTSTAQ